MNLIKLLISTLLFYANIVSGSIDINHQKFETDFDCSVGKYCVIVERNDPDRKHGSLFYFDTTGVYQVKIDDTSSCVEFGVTNWRCSKIEFLNFDALARSIDTGFVPIFILGHGARANPEYKRILGRDLKNDLVIFDNTRSNPTLFSINWDNISLESNADMKPVLHPKSTTDKVDIIIAQNVLAYLLANTTGTQKFFASSNKAFYFLKDPSENNLNIIRVSSRGTETVSSPSSCISYTEYLGRIVSIQSTPLYNENISSRNSYNVLAFSCIIYGYDTSELELINIGAKYSEFGTIDQGHLLLLK